MFKKSPYILLALCFLGSKSQAMENSKYIENYSDIEFYVKDQEKAALYVQLFHATAQGNLADLQKKLAQHGINPCDVRGPMNNTLLHEAAAHGRDKIITFLLSAGLDPATPNSRFNSAITYAAQTDNTDVMDLLLEKNPANVTILGWKCTQPLHWAAKRGKTAMVAHLIKKSANVNAESSDFDTPLSEAIIGGYHDIVQQLLTAGAQTRLGSYQFPGTMNLALNQEWIKPEVLGLIKKQMANDIQLLKKLDKCGICSKHLIDRILLVANLANFHELTCCKKVVHQNCLSADCKSKLLCPLCNQTNLLKDTTAPHQVPEGF